MPTVLDSLVVELSLDPKKFKEGQRQVVDDMRKLEEGLSSKKWSAGWANIFENMQKLQQGASKGIRGAKTETDGLTQAFTLLQGRLLAVASLFMGGMGIAEFTQHITKLTAETGRLSQNFLGITPQRLAAWEGAGASVGARPGEVGGSLQSIVGQQKEFLATGRSPLMSLMGQLGLPRGDANTSPEQIALTLSRWAAGQKDKAYASHLLTSRGGLSEGMVNLLNLGPDELNKRLKEFQQFAPTNDQIKKFQDLQASMAKLAATAEQLGREIVERLEPAIKAVVDFIQETLGKRDQAIQQGPVKTVMNPFMKGLDALTTFYAHPIEGMKGIGTWLKDKVGGGGGSGPTTLNDRFQGDGAAPTSGGAAWLSQQRSGFAQELRDNPQTRQLLAGIISAENAGAGPAVAESLMNRTMLVNQDRARRGLAPLTLHDMIVGHPSIGGGNSFYGPMRSGAINSHLNRVRTDQDYAYRMNSYIDRALGGSNVIEGHTDQGSAGDPNYIAGGVGKNINGERFNDWGYPGSREFRNKFQSQYAASEAVPKATAPVMRAGPGPGLTGLAASLMSRGGGPAPPSFAEQWDAAKSGKLGALGGASAAIARGPNTTTNTNTSSTHIGEMNVSVPQGASPDAYAHGIRQKLDQYDNVQNANTGLF